MDLIENLIDDHYERTSRKIRIQKAKKTVLVIEKISCRYIAHVQRKHVLIQPI